MPLPERITDDACGLSERWLLDPALAGMLVQMEGLAVDRFTTTWFRWPGIWIISGARTPEHQTILNPTVPRSCHVQCPSMAADLQVGAVEELQSDEVFAILGGMWMLMGGRWGGSFSDPDPNHFDLGPCL